MPQEWTGQASGTLGVLFERDEKGTAMPSKYRKTIAGYIEVQAQAKRKRQSAVEAI